MPRVKENKGSKGGFLLTDKKTGAGIIIGMWDTETNLKAGEDSAHLKETMAKFAQLVTGQITQEDYEITAQA
jgi:hypothetical protein